MNKDAKKLEERVLMAYMEGYLSESQCIETLNRIRLGETAKQENKK